MRPLVSVVVPMYNTEKYVGDCIRSVIAQTVDDWELLIVDDGSRDGSAAVVERWCGENSRIRLLRHPGGANLGVSRTRALGVREAQGQFIAFLDADDLFEPTKLAEQIALLEAQPECIVCHTQVRPLSEMGQRFVTDWERHFNLAEPQASPYYFHRRSDALERCRICNSSTVIRAAGFGGLDFSYRQLFQHEDWALWIQLSERGAFYLLPRPLTVYRIHPSSFCSGNVDNPLRPLYARVELYLSLITRVKSEELLVALEDEMFQVLRGISQVYQSPEWASLASKPTFFGPPAPKSSETHPLATDSGQVFWRRRAMKAEQTLYAIYNSRTWRVLATLHRFLDPWRSRRRT